MTDDEKEKLLKELECMTFAEIREKLDNHGYGPPHGKNYKFVSSWLLRAEASARESQTAEAISIARDAASTARSDASTTEEALSNKRLRTRWPKIIEMAAAIAAIVAAIVAIIELF